MGKFFVSTLALVLFATACTESSSEGASTAATELKQTDVYYESNVRTPMRDGVELSSDLWRPSVDKQYPTILVRTPYTKERFLGPMDLGNYYSRHGYAVVVQDVRGKGDSGGEFADLLQEEDDGHDTIEWIADQKWSDGRVCMMGLSYLGVVQWLAAKAQSPHLKCIAPAASPGHPFIDSPYRGGAFQVALLPWAYNNGETGGRPEGPQPDWDSILKQRPLNSLDERAGKKVQIFQDWVNNPTFNDFWEEATIPPDSFSDINIPALHITGWFDVSLPGTMYYWRGMKNSPAADKQYLLIGPWTHGQTFTGGESTVHGMNVGDESILDMREVALPFFDRYLKGKDTVEAPATARLFLTGANKWIELDAYPEIGERSTRLYFESSDGANTVAGDGRLTWDVPAAGRTSDSYVYDPEDPAPAFYLDSGVEKPSDQDINALNKREDVLVYTSEVLEEPLTVVGPVRLNLQMSTDARDTDFIVRILDVDPSGYETKPSINDGVIRTRYRNGFGSTSLLEPNEIVELNISVHDIAHQFQKGHRIRLQVTSSVFPNVYPNSNTGNEVATDTDVKLATQTIWHGQNSYLELPVVSY